MNKEARARWKEILDSEVESCEGRTFVLKK